MFFKWKNKTIIWKIKDRTEEVHLSFLFFFPSPLYLWTVPKILDLRIGKNKKVTGTTDPSHTDYIFMLRVYSNHFSPYLFFY